MIEIYIEIGNSSALEAYRVQDSDTPDKVHYREVPGDRITTVSFPESIVGDEAFESAVAAIANHIKPGERPAWLHSDNKDLKDRLQAFFGVKGKPRKNPWGEDTGAPLVMPPGPLAAMFTVVGGVLVLSFMSLQMRTNGGRDLTARVLGDTSSDGTGQYAAANWIGLTTNSDPPDAGNTALVGEITVGTLARAQGVFSHTNGTNSYTITKVFTSDQSVTLSKGGIFNASSGGTMAFETLLSSAAIMESGDQLQNTQTVTL